MKKTFCTQSANHLPASPARAEIVVSGVILRVSAGRDAKYLNLAICKYRRRIEDSPYNTLSAKYSESLVRNKSATMIRTEETTTACVVARPTPCVPPRTVNPL
jgi:hypothetical protein